MRLREIQINIFPLKNKRKKSFITSLIWGSRQSFLSRFQIFCSRLLSLGNLAIYCAALEKGGSSFCFPSRWQRGLSGTATVSINTPSSQQQYCHMPWSKGHIAGALLSWRLWKGLTTPPPLSLHCHPCLPLPIWSPLWHEDFYTCLRFNTW